jgi:acyl carrier protein
MASSSHNVVFSKVVSAVGQTVHIESERLTSASRLVDDLRLGRLGRLRLALRLEEMFDLELPDEAVERFQTVADIVRYMARWGLEDADVPAERSGSPTASRKYWLSW